ncbi:MAG TPA: sigma-70 family RNA polymerase sigma factor [Gemmataceae bacterium]|jgi:RNA polymerase sigma factor (sigma-70 family)
MSDRRLVCAVRQLRRLARPPAAAPADDRQLLAAFAESRAESAFAELVRRHGPLVRGVTRRVLGDADAADDVFQATFLVLARKAGAVRWRPAVGPWLYAVAYRLACKARHRRLRFVRSDNLGALAQTRSPDPAIAAAWAEVRHILDDELARLPERLRSPLVLCYLDGRTRDEAAAALGWTLATLKRRLERGRSLLRKRLEARGVTAALLAAAITPVAVPPDVTAATTAAAAAFSADGTIAAPAAALLKGAPALGGVRAAWVLLIGTIALTAGGIALAPRGPMQPPDRPAHGGDPQAGAPTETRSPAPKGDPLPAGAVARLGTLAFCHGVPVQQLLTSTDGRSIITIGGAVRIWDAASGREEGSIPAPKGQAFIAGSLLPGGDRLALSCYDGSIHIWDWKARREVRSFKPELGGGRALGPGCCAFDPTGRLAVLTWQTGIAPLVDLATGKVKDELSTQSDPVLAATFTADGKIVITAGGAAVRLWDVATGKQQRQIASPVLPANAVAVSPNAVAVSADGRWLAMAGAKPRVMPAPGGGTVSMSEVDKEVHVIDVTTGRDVRQLDVGASGTEPPTLLFTPDSRFLITGAVSEDGQFVRQWDVATGKRVREFPGSGTSPPALALSPDGRTLLTADTVVRRWEWQTGKEMSEPTENPGNVSALAFLPDGRSLVTGGNGVMVWDATTGRKLRRVAAPPGLVDGIALAPDGRTLAVVSHAGEPRHLAVVETATGRQIREAKLGDGHLGGLVLSPDGKSLATATFNDGVVRIWDYATLTERRAVKLRLPGGGQSFSPDGRTLRGLMVANERDTMLFSVDTATGQLTEHGRLGSATHLSAFSWSPDGRVLATGGWRGDLSNLTAQTDRAGIYLFDAATGMPVRELTGVGFVPFQIAFSPDGKRLAAGDWNGAVTTWDLTTGKRVREFAGHRGRIVSLAFSPDGKRLASGSIDTTVLVWDVGHLPPDRP